MPDLRLAVKVFQALGVQAGCNTVQERWARVAAGDDTLSSAWPSGFLSRVPPEEPETRPPSWGSVYASQASVRSPSSRVNGYWQMVALGLETLGPKP